jgi:predicted HTH domain antitoxin
MNMSTLNIDCAAELAVALGRREAELEKEVRLASALKLFEMGRISSGLAAKLAGMSRVEFLLLCGHYNVSVFQQDPAEVESDAFAALEASRT